MPSTGDDSVLWRRRQLSKQFTANNRVNYVQKWRRERTATSTTMSHPRHEEIWHIATVDSSLTDRIPSNATTHWHDSIITLHYIILRAIIVLYYGQYTIIICITIYLYQKSRNTRKHQIRETSNQMITI